jgi:hypothetical protein
MRWVLMVCGQELVGSAGANRHRGVEHTWGEYNLARGGCLVCMAQAGAVFYVRCEGQLGVGRRGQKSEVPLAFLPSL